MFKCNKLGYIRIKMWLYLYNVLKAAVQTVIFIILFCNLQLCQSISWIVRLWGTETNSLEVT